MKSDIDNKVDDQNKGFLLAYVDRGEHTREDKTQLQVEDYSLCPMGYFVFGFLRKTNRENVRYRTV